MKVPVAPVGPVVAVGPVGPIGPVAPVRPVGPVSPVRPVRPVGPVTPVAPVRPVAPSTFPNKVVCTCEFVPLRNSILALLLFPVKLQNKRMRMRFVKSGNVIAGTKSENVYICCIPAVTATASATVPVFIRTGLLEPSAST